MPDSKTEAAQGRVHGGLRASHADREQVIGTLKAAFVQGRLTREELGERAGQVLASRTYAELAEVTADLPAERSEARSRRDPWRAAEIAWRIGYAMLLPGVFSLLVLKGADATEATMIIVLTVVYLVFWIFGLLIVIASREAPQSAGRHAVRRVGPLGRGRQARLMFGHGRA